LFGISASPAIAQNVGSQSWVLDDLVRDDPGRDFAGPSDEKRDAEGALPVGVLLAAERRHPTAVHMRAVVGRIHDERVVGDPQRIEVVEYLADILVMVDHCVVVWRLVLTGLAEARGLRVRSQVHVGGVEPQEKRLAGVVLPLDEVLRRGDEFVVARFHALFGERAGVFDRLLADTTPARLLGRIVLVGRVTMEDASRTEALLEPRILRIVGVFRVFFCIEVIQVAKELVEAVRGGQEPVQIAEVVLAELPGGVPDRFEEIRDRRILGLQANGRAG
jgi:hypothetical protein